MPRARNIKPGFFENEHLGSLPGDTRLLFAALWTLADKQGVVECRISKIRTYAFRYRLDITDEMVHRELTVLTRLDNGRMLSKASFDGNDYLLIHNFVKHASPHHTEKRGDYPDFELLKTLINNDVEEITVNSRKLNGENPPEYLILNTESLTLNPENAIEESRLQEILNQFEIFWKDFPTNGRNKGSKKDAGNKFKIALKKSTFNEIMQGVNNYANYLNHTGQSNQDAFRWLEKERWRDDYTIHTKPIRESAEQQKSRESAEAAVRGMLRAENPNF